MRIQNHNHKGINISLHLVVCLSIRLKTFCFRVWRHKRCGNKEIGLLLLLISGNVDDEEEGRALTRGLPSTVTQRFIHAHRLVWP
jgi:hypothetical protein